MTQLSRMLALRRILPLLAMTLTVINAQQKPQHALFFRTDADLGEVLAAEATQNDAFANVLRATRDAESDPSRSDSAVRSILEWIQSVYTQTGKKAIREPRQGQPPSRYYLPSEQRPTERPRPFQTNPTAAPTSPQPGGYSYESSPQPPFLPSTTQQPPFPGPGPSQQPIPIPNQPGFSSTYQPSYSTTYQPSSSSTYRPPPSSSRPSPSPFPSQPPSISPSPFPSRPPSISPSPFPSAPPSSFSPVYPSPSSFQPQVTTSSETTTHFTSGSTIDSEAHPPHIHDISVECAKDMMTINIEFNRVFNGVIYSKGYYKENSCRYVSENSDQTKYSFTVSLNSCGTQFVDQFKEPEGQAYLENVLVLQNEPGIQEVWDVVRRVRCLWEGNINKALSVGLNVDMLNQEIVTFSGDTAVARLDIQTGRGPFAPAANGLVKIGETMTLVITVEGDAGFDVTVRDCVARDLGSQQVVRLTDERGCVLKPKLFGAFQKTRETGNTGAAVIAYAFFQAFKFPDIMELTLDCNVELCKVNCDMCPDPNQPLEPESPPLDPSSIRRRRRDVNATLLHDDTRIHRTFRIVSPDDLEDEKLSPGATIINVASQHEGVCMTWPGFILFSSVLLLLLIIAWCSTAWLWIRQVKQTKGFA